MAPKPWSPYPRMFPSGTALRRSSRLATAKSGTSENPPKKPKPSRPPRVKKGDSQPRQCTGMLYLRVHRAVLSRFTAPTEGQPNPAPLPPLSGTTGNLNVIIASLADLCPFSDDTADWLIRVARLVFEPLGMGSLYTFTTDTLQSWLNRDMDPTWVQVEHGEQLRATIYEFRPNNTPIMLSKISLRQARSVTTNVSRPQATAFHNALNARDGACVISTYSRPTIGSHLAPKRLGDSGVQSVIQRFTVSHAPVGRFHPTIGVLLLQTLDAYVDIFELGFWYHGPVSLLSVVLYHVNMGWQNQYVVHNFSNDPMNILGLEPRIPNVPMLHGHPITLTTHNGSPLPPVGVFNWHYLQCVLKRFATDEYKQIQNIYHFTMPFRTEDDDDESDFDFDDERNIANPPYPSYPIELAEARARQHLEDAERNCAIAEWNSRVSKAI